MTSLPAFDTPDLARAVEALTSEQVDDLPYGAIRLTDDGVIDVFSRAEATLSGYGSRPALGRRLFVDVAPCFSNPAFLGRIERALAEGAVDIEFGMIGDFDDAAKELRVRVQSASRGGIWVFTLRR